MGKKFKIILLILIVIIILYIMAGIVGLYVPFCVGDICSLATKETDVSTVPRPPENPEPLPLLADEDKVCNSDSDCYMITLHCFSTGCPYDGQVKVNKQGLDKVLKWKEKCEYMALIDCIPDDEIPVPFCIDNVCGYKLIPQGEYFSNEDYRKRNYG